MVPPHDPSRIEDPLMMEKKKDPMTSRERVHACVKGLPVDRVPLFFWLNAHTGVRLMAEYRPSKNKARNLAARLIWKRFNAGGGMDAGEFWRMAPLFFDIHMLNWANAYSVELGSDLFMVAHATPWRYAKFFREDGHMMMKDLFGVTRSIAGIYPDMARPAINDIDEARAYRFPDTKAPALYNAFRRARKAHPEASICAEIWGVQDFTATSLFGMERFMMYLYDYPEEMKTFLGRWADYQVEIIRNSVAAGADIVAIFDDYGYDNRQLISMEMWKEFTYPHLKRLVDVSHEAGALVLMHSCGYQMPFLPHYAEAGIDMLQSFQPKAGNDFESAHREFGDRFTFVTGIDIQQGESMNPEEFREDILAGYRIGGRKGGHILGTTHEMQYTMPMENIRAIFDTTAEIGAGLHDD